MGTTVRLVVFFLCLWRAITMAIPNRDNEFLKNPLFIKFPCIWFNYLNSGALSLYIYRMFILLPLWLCHLGQLHHSSSPLQLYHCVVPHLLFENVWPTPTYFWRILCFFSKIFVNNFWCTTLYCCWSTYAVPFVYLPFLLQLFRHCRQLNY